jgi:hypothetical protein
VERQLSNEYNEQFNSKASTLEYYEVQLKEWLKFRRERGAFTIGEAIVSGLGMSSDDISRLSVPVGKVLKSLGFVKKRIRHDGGRMVVFEHPAEDRPTSHHAPLPGRGWAG